MEKTIREKRRGENILLLNACPCQFKEEIWGVWCAGAVVIVVLVLVFVAFVMGPFDFFFIQFYQPTLILFKFVLDACIFYLIYYFISFRNFDLST